MATVGKVTNKATGKSYVVTKIDVGDWKCSCHSPVPVCAHKRMVWTKKALSRKFTVVMIKPQLLKRGVM